VLSLEGNQQLGPAERAVLRQRGRALIGYAFNTAWRGGNGAATQVFEDYRDFGGVRMATSNTTRDGDDVSLFTITSVTWDDVPDSVFELPAAVRAKMKH
jgi:hypothetical protein